MYPNLVMEAKHANQVFKEVACHCLVDSYGDDSHHPSNGTVNHQTLEQ